MKISRDEFIKKSGLSLYKKSANNENVYFSDLCIDSRKATSDELFAAISCAKIKDYICDAYKKGIRSFVVEENQNHIFHNFNDVIVFNTKNCRLMTAQLASIFYPDTPKNIIYITGTNGKSSTVSLLRQIWSLNNKKAASLGTIGLELENGIDHTLDVPALTSPDAISFHKILSYLKSQHIDYLACEASSHGLDQYRMDGAKINVGGFLNLTQDHLDYHASMGDYFNAKSQLFKRVLPEGKIAVLNIDSPYFDQLKNIAKTRNQKIISYGRHNNADFKVLNLRITNNHMNIDLDFCGMKKNNISFHLFGEFQIENLLCACAMAYASGIEIIDIINIISNLKSIPGRMDYIGKTKSGGLVFVDFAHTPDALENILKAARHHSPAKLHLVFGCGGDRDASKRPLMGDIAHQYADVVYVTDDNPRFEDAKKIRSEILCKTPNAIEFDNRAMAIKIAMENLQENDILIIAGKGHEQGQSIKGIVHPFSDKVHVLNYLNTKEYIHA